MSTQMQPAQKQQFDLSPQSFEQALTLAKYMAESDLVPKEFKGKPANCLIAMQWGAEVGLKPLQSLQNISVVNGRPALWGDAIIAIVMASPICEYIDESDDGNTATCKVKRRGGLEQMRTFSMDDAKQAALMTKDNWKCYPKRMRQMRARAFALRDVFPDILKGFPVAEELMDMPQEKNMGTAEVVNTSPAMEKYIAPALPAYPSEDFEKNIDAWKNAITSGRVTADAVIAKAGTKGVLTDDQKERIKNAAQIIDAPYAQLLPQADELSVDNEPGDNSAINFQE